MCKLQSGDIVVVVPTYEEKIKYSKKTIDVILISEYILVIQGRNEIIQNVRNSELTRGK